MSKPKVLLLGKIDHVDSNAEWQRLQSSGLFEVITPKSTCRAEFLSECASGALNGILAAYRTFSSASITGLIDSELVGALPTSLRYLCHNGAGYDQISIPACTARNIQVSNVPTAVDDSTADVNLFLLLGALRLFNAGMSRLRQGGWVTGLPLGHDPQQKTLGILGMGGIGRALKRRTDPLGMKCIYHNRNQLAPELEEGAEYVSFDELLARSDVLSLNLPLNPATRHIISKAEFDKMKDGVVVVNTARGAVMDEAALVEALDRGKVASVGLDVYEDEPKVHEGLVKNESVLLVPHMGTYTFETQTKMEMWCISNVEAAVKTRELRSLVPEQKGVEFKA